MPPSYIYILKRGCRAGGCRGQHCHPERWPSRCCTGANAVDSAHRQHERAWSDSGRDDGVSRRGDYRWCVQGSRLGQVARDSSHVTQVSRDSFECICHALAPVPAPRPPPPLHLKCDVTHSSALPLPRTFTSAPLAQRCCTSGTLQHTSSRCGKASTQRTLRSRRQRRRREHQHQRRRRRRRQVPMLRH